MDDEEHPHITEPDPGDPSQAAPEPTWSPWREPYSDRVREHLRDPRGVGRLPSPDAVGEAGSTRCGDLVRLELALAGGVVTAAQFQAYGCPVAIAGAAEVAARVPGLSLLQVARLGAQELAETLDVPPERSSCSDLAADALHVALEDAVRRGADLVAPGAPVDQQGVLVGMSGGVDSSVAALVLQEQGFRVVGATFRLWSDPACRVGKSCCSPESILDARAVAHRLGLPHLTIDLSAAFHREVVEDFVAQYRAARTPNPCVRCNAVLRFAALAQAADRLGLRWIATGHYARMLGDPPRLHRGSDPLKDQSYVLAEVAPALLRRARFPVGELDKAATRTRARAGDLPAHDAAESQDICFIPDGDYRRFLSERMGETPGDIVDQEGRVLGRHRGVYRYTIGQRRGLGVASPEPLFVVALRPETGQVVVGPAAAAEVTEVTVAGLVRHGTLPRQAAVQLRSSGGTVPVTIIEVGQDAVGLRLARPVQGVAPGQAAVIYEGEAVVAAGTITASQAG
jgi:tRNA-specific 2-thiouridylase